MEIKTELEKTIFVAIACVGNDTELVRTVSSCINNASNGSRVHVGINLVYGIKMDEDDMYIYHLEEALSQFENARYCVNYISDPPSIGKDRNNASRLYRGEDYFLQVDAHCFFMPNWDTELIDALGSAIKLVNNKKTVLTATLPKYELNENSITDNVEPERICFGYSYWTGEFKELSQEEKEIVPSWAHTSPEMHSFRLARMVQKTGFSPAVKVTGAFMFGNKHFAEKASLPEHIVFWEEEIVQSIELVSLGFTLVYPYILANIYHYYQIDETNTGRGFRSGLGNLIMSSAFHAGYTLSGEEDEETLRNPEKWPELDSDQIENAAVAWRAAITSSFESYLNNPENQAKISAFSKYSGVSFKTGKTAFDFPEIYANIGALAVGEKENV
jgi:hypothetical protein